MRLLLTVTAPQENETRLTIAVNVESVLDTAITKCFCRGVTVQIKPDTFSPESGIQVELPSSVYAPNDLKMSPSAPNQVNNRPIIANQGTCCEIQKQRGNINNMMFGPAQRKSNNF